MTTDPTPNASSVDDSSSDATSGNRAPRGRSRWWYLVVLALLGSLAMTAAGLYVIAVLNASLGGSLAGIVGGLPGPSGAIGTAFWLGGFVTGFLGAVGARIDAMQVRPETGWPRSPRRYAYGMVAATVLFPPLVSAVSALYLYRRHRHVGTP